MNAHSRAILELASYSPVGSDQMRLRDRYLRLLDACPDALSRDCHPAHLTAGALVINQSRDQVLLNLHAKAKRWFHFGGHLEPADSALAAGALREAREESGIATLWLSPGIVQLDEHVVQFCDGRVDTHHLDVRYVAFAFDDAVPVVSQESLSVRWFALGDLPELEPEMHQLIELALSVGSSGGHSIDL